MAMCVGPVGVNVHKEKTSTKDLMSTLLTLQGYSALKEL